jgi:hypothetical protein
MLPLVRPPEEPESGSLPSRLRGVGLSRLDAVDASP